MIRKETIIGPCRLLLGDCRDILPALEGTAADLVTDPPYGINLQNNDSGGGRSERWGTIAGDGDTRIGEFVIAWGRRHAGTVIAFASPELPWPGQWRNRIVWDKGGAVGGGGDTATCLKRSWELIQVHNAGPIRGPRRESVWRFPMVPADTAAHICAKPVALMAQLLNTFCADDIIDPCFGSGSTGVACIKTGRRFTGIEIDDGFYAEAVQRIRTAWGDGTLFERRRDDKKLFDDADAG